MLPFLPHNLTAKGVCLAISMTMALFMYVPLFRRFTRRHHTRDLSKTFCWLNFAVQVNNGVLAVSEHAPFLVFWYAVQTITTGVTLWLVYKYWNFPQPK